ncbi:hypothetical protein PPACK8108_LOCUS26247 [Phakopsora pachyrhizi]|uniref:Uncharacterized protein n=1 Tax=Phakopsora pachyrhizi TaxID=170000 RepID=A0AAV0BVT3_PHAPC|nr:hypothetical protein PPACK8108_LOCUS26247 [Phakopsora pachyrhizi]
MCNKEVWWILLNFEDERVTVGRNGRLHWKEEETLGGGAHQGQHPPQNGFKCRGGKAAAAAGGEAKEKPVLGLLSEEEENLGPITKDRVELEENLASLDLFDPEIKHKSIYRRFENCHLGPESGLCKKPSLDSSVCHVVWTSWMGDLQLLLGEGRDEGFAC